MANNGNDSLSYTGVSGGGRLKRIRRRQIHAELCVQRASSPGTSRSYFRQPWSSLVCRQLISCKRISTLPLYHGLLFPLMPVYRRGSKRVRIQCIGKHTTQCQSPSPARSCIALCTSNFSMTARWRLDLVRPDFPLPFVAANSDSSLPETGVECEATSVAACEK